MDKNDKDFCVYFHRRVSDGSIFYVGQGRKKRALNLKSGRNKSHLAVVNSEECYCEILQDNLTKQDAENLEELMIIKLLEEGVKLTNTVKKVSRAKHIKREDYYFLDYCEETFGNLVWNEDRYAGNSKNPYLAVKAGSRAATQNKHSGYCLFKNTMAHRIVYAILHGECPSDKQVNHKNGIKHDNRKENLELVSPKENTAHALLTGLKVMPKGENCHASILKDDEVKLMYEYFRHGFSNEEVAEIYNIEWKHVSLIRNGKRWKHLFSTYGYSIPSSSKAIVTTNSQIADALLLIDAGLTNKDISLATSIEPSTVSRIRSGTIFTSKLDRLKPEYFLISQ